MAARFQRRKSMQVDDANADVAGPGYVPLAFETLDGWAGTLDELAVTCVTLT